MLANCEWSYFSWGWPWMQGGGSQTMGLDEKPLYNCMIDYTPEKDMDDGQR
jgi:hypothetical protein